MSTAERKAKEKEELKALILNTAMKLFIEDGIERTTIRSIADKINYSVGTVYVYYKDKNEILYAINNLGFQQLKEKMSLSLSIEDPLERLKSMLSGYIQFALDNKELYDLMFIMNAPMLYLEGNGHKEWCEGKGAYGVIKNTVDACLKAGHFKNQSLDFLTLNLWALVHGLSSLCIRKRLNAIDYPDSIITETINDFYKIM